MRNLTFPKLLSVIILVLLSSMDYVEAQSIRGTITNGINSSDKIKDNHIKSTSINYVKIVRPTEKIAIIDSSKIFSFSPNPCSDRIIFTNYSLMKILGIKIYQINGILVEYIQGEFNGAKYQLNLENLPSDTYIIVVDYTDVNQNKSKNSYKIVKI